MTERAKRAATKGAGVGLLSVTPADSSAVAAGSLLTVEHLSVADVAGILAMTARLERMDAAERARVLLGRTVALLFYESSTRTRTSFELAAKSLGATTTLVSDKSSSIEKGESLKDTGLTLRALGAEAIILRHPSSGAASLLARVTGLRPTVVPGEIGFDVNGRDIVLTDDVLYTGRTVRAAMDALFDHGRPKSVQLLVLIDRGHRELPIQATYTGRTVPTSRREIIEVKLNEIDGQEQVLLVELVD